MIRQWPPPNRSARFPPEMGYDASPNPPVNVCYRYPAGIHLYSRKRLTLRTWHAHIPSPPSSHCHMMYCTCLIPAYTLTTLFHGQAVIETLNDITSQAAPWGPFALVDLGHCNLHSCRASSIVVLCCEETTWYCSWRFAYSKQRLVQHYTFIEVQGCGHGHPLASKARSIKTESCSYVTRLIRSPILYTNMELL